VILYKGKPHQIKIIFAENPSSKRIKVNTDSIMITAQKDENPLLILKNWLRSQTEELILRQTNSHKDALGEPTKVFITDTARADGSPLR
jgi:predicted metal-dependent hydrolase